MAIREQRFNVDDQDIPILLLLDNPAVKKNYGRTRGQWIFFVEGEARAELLEGLRREVKAGRLVNVAVGESPSAGDISQRFLLAEEEGHLPRRQFCERLRDFERIGFEGPWVYVDAGADRDATPRRMLFAKSPRAVATEIDHRGSGEPTIKQVPFKLRESRGRWSTEFD